VVPGGSGSGIGEGGEGGEGGSGGEGGGAARRAPCRHVVWLHTSAPHREHAQGYAQTARRARRWNALVEALLREREFARAVTAVDLFGASVDVSHADNIHMHGSFYKGVAELLWALT
jgi:hypothetical protein